MAGLKDKTDWNKCLYCQLHTSEPLACPATSKRTIVGAGYVSLAEHAATLNELGKIPEDVIRRLREGGSFLETLQSKEAKFHKNCRSKYNKTIIDRIKKNQSSVASSSSASRQPRASTQVIKVCFFCNNPETLKETLRTVATQETEQRIRDGATSLERHDLLVKMATRDLVAQEASYHLSCLTHFYNQVRTYERKSYECESEPDALNISFTELVMYIESATEATFMLPELRKMINDRLLQLQGDKALSISSHRLQEKLLKHFAGLRSQSNPPKPTILAFEKDVGKIIRDVASREPSYNFTNMANVVNICRAEMFNDQDTKCTGSLIDYKQNIPLSLVTLIKMLLYGPSITDQRDNEASLPAESIAQLVMFNATKYTRGCDTHKHRHTTKREPALPLYIGLLVHSHTRQKKIIDNLALHGLSVSYNRVLQCSKQVSDAVCQIYKDEGVVCPPALQKNVFCTAAFDNIDYNPSSVTAEGALHGTSISIVQHLDRDTKIERRRTLSISESSPSSSLRVKSLPSFYTDIFPYTLKEKEPKIPPIPENCLINFKVDPDIEKKVEKNAWLEQVRHSVDQDNPGSISWAAYHACQQPDETKGLSRSVLLPLLPDPSHSIAVIRHIFCNVQKTIEAVNPNQTTVITMDQPLYALGKILQWNDHEEFGERKVVLMMGAFHIEMNFMALIGNLLEKSGITSALTRAEVCGEGKAQSFLKASHPRRARYIHEVLSAALYILSVHAYDTFKAENADNLLEFEEWKKQQSADYAAFHYWNMILGLELLRSTFVRSIRTSNFGLYLETLKSMAPWFFAVNHTNYARWIPVHIRDMELLPFFAPDIYAEFCSGKFTLKKPTRGIPPLHLTKAMNKKTN